MKNYIAERRLLFSLKDNDFQQEFTIGLTTPYSVDQKSVDFDIGEGLYACDIELDGLDEKSHTVYGMDSLQAVHIASNGIEHFLKRLRKKYDFFWHPDEPYFEEIKE